VPRRSGYRNAPVAITRRIADEVTAFVQEQQPFERQPTLLRFVRGGRRRSPVRPLAFTRNRERPRRGRASHGLAEAV
jgi:hypothetical protein